MEIDKNNAFFTLLEELSEKNRLENCRKLGISGDGTWRDLEDIYDMLLRDDIRAVYEDPTKYFSEALEVVASPEFDQSQKIYTILMMQDLPIKHYMYLMDAANTAYENGIITDKEVMIRAINPDIKVSSTSVYYWWLPDWQERFKKYASEFFSEEYIKQVIGGIYKPNIFDYTE